MGTLFQPLNACQGRGLIQTRCPSPDSSVLHFLQPPDIDEAPVLRFRIGGGSEKNRTAWQTALPSSIAGSPAIARVHGRCQLSHRRKSDETFVG
jgi:hypothetical protein